jgi:hypothetical protein
MPEVHFPFCLVFFLMGGNVHASLYNVVGKNNFHGHTEEYWNHLGSQI